MKKTQKFIRNEKGSALVTVFMVITIMTVLGMGILALSQTNLKQSVKVDTFERSYYVAEGGAKQSVAAIRAAALDQYNTIADDVKSNSNENIGSNTASSFFSGVESRISSFAPSQPDSSAGGPTSDTVTITNDGGSPTRIYTVVSTASDSSAMQRNVKSQFSLTFKKVTIQTAAFTPLGSQVLLCGGKFDSSSGYVSISGTALFGDLAYKSWNFNYNGNSNPDAATIASLKSSALASQLNWQMKYPSFTTEAKTAVTPTIPALANGTTVTNSAFKDPPFNWTVPSPIYLEGQAGASFTISSSMGTYNGGQIYCTGSLTDSAEIDGTSSSYVKIYSTGTFTQSNGQLNYVKIFGGSDVTLNNGPAVNNSYIYSHGNVKISGRTMNNLLIICDGNLTISGGGTTNVTVYCKGTVNDSSNTRTNFKVYCDTYSMSGGSIQGNSIVYAQTNMHLESTVQGLFYCNGDITCGSGSGITGQIAAKGNITTTGYSFTMDSNLLAQLYADSFVSSSPASSSITVVQPSNTNIFTNTPSYQEP